MGAWTRGFDAFGPTVNVKGVTDLSVGAGAGHVKQRSLSTDFGSTIGHTHGVQDNARREAGRWENLRAEA